MRPREIVDSLKTLITECDAVVCLIGPAYGAAPGGQTPGQRSRSYTQFEYEAAQNCQKRLYVFYPSEACLPKLDPIEDEESPEEIDNQATFVEETKKSSKGLWQEFDNQADLDAKIVKLWGRLQLELRRADPADLPSPCCIHAKKISDLGRVQDCKSSLAKQIAFIACLIAAESSMQRSFFFHEFEIEQLDAMLSLLRKLSDDLGSSASPLIPEMAAWLREQFPKLSHKLGQLCAIDEQKLKSTEFRKHLDDWKKTLVEIVEQWAFFRKYLVVAVELNEDKSPALRVYRGLSPQQFVPVTLEPGSSAGQVSPGAVFLLSLQQRKALELSSCLMPFPGNALVLSVLSALKDSGSAEAVPLSDGDEDAPRKTPRIEDRFLGPRGTLLSVECWVTLDGRYLRPADRHTVVGTGLKIVTKPRHIGHFFDLCWAEDQNNPSRDLFVVYLVKDDDEIKNDKDIRDRLAKRLELWRCFAKHAGDQIVVPLDCSNFSHTALDPFIATRLETGALSLKNVATRHSRFSEADIAAVIKFALDVCAVAEGLGIGLLAIPLRHILVKPKKQSQPEKQYLLTGFDAVVGMEEPLPEAAIFRKVFPDWEDFAPELADGECHPAHTAGVYAIGALLRELRHEKAQPLPLGNTEEEKKAYMEGTWRNTPLECFAYHCLARDPNRRFQSIAQCKAFFERWAENGWTSEPLVPELVDLDEGLSISRFPVTNYEFEFYCRERRRPLPGRSLSVWFRSPFAPVVCVSPSDAQAYCDWLSRLTKLNWRWRLPTESEWVRAARRSRADSLYPLGQDPPTFANANYGGRYGGPTVVGANRLAGVASECHDLAGNVWEWCADRFASEPRRVVKGGSFGSPREELSIATRKSRFFGGRYDDVGFRVVCEKK